MKALITLNGNPLIDTPTSVLNVEYDNERQLVAKLKEMQSGYSLDNKDKPKISRFKVPSKKDPSKMRTVIDCSTYADWHHVAHIGLWSTITPSLKLNQFTLLNSLLVMNQSLKKHNKGDNTPQIAPKKRKKMYLDIAADISSPNRKNNGICYYLSDLIPGFERGKTKEPWGYASCRPFPEICLFAFDEKGNSIPGTYFLMEDDYELRENILLFCAAMI